jgi:hypothetical protein
MGRLLLLALAALVAWRLVRSRRSSETVVVGWEDGSALTVDAAAPEHEPLVLAARSVIGR